MYMTRIVHDYIWI